MPFGSGGTPPGPQAFAEHRTPGGGAASDSELRDVVESWEEIGGEWGQLLNLDKR